MRTALLREMKAILLEKEGPYTSLKVDDIPLSSQYPARLRDSALRAFFKVLNASMAKNKVLSAEMTNKYDAPQVTDHENSASSLTIWVALPQKYDDITGVRAAWAQEIRNAIQKYELGTDAEEGEPHLFAWDHDKNLPDSSEYRRIEANISKA